MHVEAVKRQRTIFGDGWIYEHMLREIGEHPLIRLKEVVDRILISSEHVFEKYYSPEEGRPAYPAGVLLKMLLLEYIYGLSDVQVSRMCVHDFLFRYFIGLDVVDRVPDATTLVKFRRRLGEEGMREVFERVVAEAKEEGLVKSKKRIFDATHIYSASLLLGRIGIIKEGARRIVRKISRKRSEVAEKLKEKYKNLLSSRPTRKDREDEIKKAGGEFLEEVKGEIESDEHLKTIAGIMEEVIKNEKNQISSLTDPDARWGRKNISFKFYGYKAHVAVQENGFITSVEVLPGNTNEARNMLSMIEEERKRGFEIKEAYGDSHYDSGFIRKSLEEKGIKPFIPSRREKALADNFKLKDENLICPAGNVAISKTKQGNGYLYCFSTKQCASCRYFEKCVGDKKDRRARVYISNARMLRRNEEKEKYIKIRPVVERVFAWAKKLHGMGRARYMGKWRVSFQVMLTFMLINLKILSTYIHSPP